jgi:hypothetical protein
MTTGSGSLIAAEASHQLIHPFGEVCGAVEGRDRVVLPHGIRAKRVHCWILGAIRPEDRKRSAVLGYGEGLTSLDPGQNLRCMLVEIPRGGFHDTSVLHVVHTGG